MAVWLITGGTGFLGRHVLDAIKAGAEGLVRADTEVVALGRRCPAGWPEQSFFAVDLNDTARLRQAIQSISPDFVIHTAGRTPPAPDEELYRSNFWATLHLLDALRAVRKALRLILSGSAAELGSVPPEQLPVNESYSCQPDNAYGRSKWFATRAGLAQSAPLEVLVGRVFNPIGPRTPGTQALGQFADRLSDPDPDPDPLKLRVGDLEARRDFIDVRDVALAMIAIALRGQAGRIYHVGTGESHRVGDGLERLIRLSGRSVEVGVDPSLERRRGPADSCADINRIVSDTGWRPSISWEQSLADLWGEARDRKRPPRFDEAAAA
jgi:nucleoside-diphosphate-sugar epimerase